MSAAAALVLAALPLRYRLPGLGETPDAEALAWVVAYSDSLCTQDACRQKPEAVKVERIECQPLSARRIDAWQEWNVIGGARCSFSYAEGKRGERVWYRVTRTFIYEKYGCGEAGQEADMWCYTWHLRDDE